jgi:hypothetical protein
MYTLKRCISIYYIVLSDRNEIGELFLSRKIDPDPVFPHHRNRIYLHDANLSETGMRRGCDLAGILGSGNASQYRRYFVAFFERERERERKVLSTIKK